MLTLTYTRLFKKYFLMYAWVFMLSATFHLVAQEQLGRPFINNYSYQEYNASAVNWWAIEDDEGIMYFANNGGILEYDGVNWNKLDIDYPVRNFTKDDQGTIYVGSEGDIGYLTRDDIGNLQYISLADKIPEEHRSLSTVWEVDIYKGRVIFRTEYKLYCWDGENMKIIVSKEAFHVGDIVNDVYYLRIWGIGLCILKDDDTFELVPGGEQFADIRIYALLPYDDQKVLIGTRKDGFFIYDGKSFKPFKTEVDEYIKGNLYLPGAALDDGRFVFNTFSDGVYMIDHGGKLIQKYTTDNGLQEGSVDFVYVDSRGVLWMMLFNGISNVNLNSTFTVLDSNMGLSTNVVFAVYKFKNILYLNSNNGIYYIEDGSREIFPIEGTHGQAGQFLEFRDRLFTGTGGMGILELTGKTFEFVQESKNYDLRVRDLFMSKIDKKRMYAYHQQGINSFYFNESTNKFEAESLSKLVIPDGFGGGLIERSDGSLWIESEKDGVINLMKPNINDKKLDFDSSQIFTYDKSHGLPDSHISIGQFDGKILFYAEDTE